MKVLGIISTATLFLLLGTAVPVLAQGDHQEEAKPQKQEQAKPERQQQQAKAAKQEPQATPAQPKGTKQDTQSRPAQHEQQAKAAKQQQQAKAEQRQEQAKNLQQRSRSNNQQQAKATTPGDRQQANDRQPQRSAADQQRQRSQPELRLSARSESRIPDDRFRSNFGRGHEFRIGTPRLVDGYSRFQYGGYWFGFVQPWPAGWYYTDDVYVDYINGQYYLCNPSYPGDQIAISVVL